MLFNSFEFAIFLPIVFILYWFVTQKHLRLQNILLLVASYVFYGWWDWRFLSLIVFSSFIDFFVGVQLGKTELPNKRKALLLISILVNLGFLGFFKYFNFFAESFADAFTLLGKPMEVSRLKIILPVGISFYTFQTLSYSIDVYKKRLEPTKDIIAFFAFVSFFPQLVAGPIERATNLLPQFYKKREFDYEKAVDGMRQILWGLFKKVVIADNCAQAANDIFANYSDQSGNMLVIGAILFAFQIYGDFSGYSDIAIGTSRLFGFNLMQNFAFPYFSRDIAEFWRRWHISLSTWFRDYLYIPLGGSKGGLQMKVRNTLIIFVVSGFWHGANWTFMFWGFLNALYFLPLLLTKRNRTNLEVVAANRWYPNLKEVMQMLITFSLTLVAWIFFRSESIGDAFLYLKHMLIDNYLSHPGQLVLLPKQIVTHPLFPFILGLLAMEWIHRKEQYGLAKIELVKYRPIKWLVYYGIIFIIFWYSGTPQEFIYFQF